MEVGKHFWGDLWGSREEFPIKVVVSIEPLYATDSIGFYCCVGVKGHWRQEPSGSRTWMEERVTQTRRVIQYRELRMARSPVSLYQNILQEMRKSASEIALHIFEADPRYGTHFYIDATSYPSGDPFSSDAARNKPLPKALPEAPMFDHRGGPRAPAVKTPHTLLSPREEKLWSSCGKCGAPFMFGMSVWWAGGNLRWICEGCANPQKPPPLERL